MDVLAHSNRIDYGEALMPDEGWITSWAIGTTFSLDLEVLLTIPLALFHGKDLHETPDATNLRADMLDSLEKVKDKMFVFVQQNNIKAMKKYSLLMSFLDHNIWEMPLKTANQSFHPKLWLIRYEKDSSYKYRLIVLSRNITTATDFDISAVLEGSCTTDNVENNKPIIDVMVELMRKADNHPCQKTITNQIRKELKKVKFSAPAPFQENYYEFYPQIGCTNDCPLLSSDFKFEHLMVVSPFVDDISLSRLATQMDKENNIKPILISRNEQMEKCAPATLNDWDCYCWASSIADEDDMDAEYDISLHAKIYIMEAQKRHEYRFSTDRKTWNYWYLGSTNCTTAGMERNYEALLQLRSDNDSLSVTQAFQTLLKSNLIIKYNIPSNEQYKQCKKEQNKLQSLEQKMRECIFSLSKLQIKGSATDKKATGRYNVSLLCDKTAWKEFKENYGKDFDIRATVPAGTNETWNLAKQDSAEFHNVPCQELSRFLKIVVKLKGQKLIPEKSFLIDTGIVIPPLRHKRVMEQILYSDERMLRYLLFILDNDMPEKDQFIGMGKSNQSGKSPSSTWGQYALPVYERLLLAASRDKTALKEFIEKAEKLKGGKGERKSILNDDFFKMVDLFKPYINEKIPRRDRLRK